MKQQAILDILPDHVDGARDFMIFGHFLEHFHRQVYGGVYDPGSHLADENGFRRDVIEALRQIKTPVIRWPGGCFVSAYPWKKGVGERVPYYDKAWRVEEPNSFGTDEFVALCREVGAEPFICTNAGTGTPEDMSDWVEYCNLHIGEWAAKRATNGHDEPFNVRYWSIGNENYGHWEMGAKTADEWARLVLESAKMMKRVDHRIELAIASIPDLDWNAAVLREAGHLLDWISIHGYWSVASDEGVFEKSAMIISSRAPLSRKNASSTSSISLAHWVIWGSCESPLMNGICAAGAIHTLCAFGAADHALMDANDINSNYNMADAVFTACFLNSCLRHCDVVGMANFSPVVNTVGAIFTYEDGIVLRPTYHVFDLFANHTYNEVLHSALRTPSFDAASGEGGSKSVPQLDAVVTRDRASGNIGVTLVNLHGEDAISCRVRGLGAGGLREATLRTLNGATAGAYNDVDQPDAVSISESALSVGDPADFAVECPPHSVTVLSLSAVN